MRRQRNQCCGQPGMNNAAADADVVWNVPAEVGCALRSGEILGGAGTPALVVGTCGRLSAWP